MIAALLSDPVTQKQSLLLVLEPGNLENLQMGKPIVKDLNEFFPDLLPPGTDLLIGFSPDIVWVAEQFTERLKSNSAHELGQLLKRSMDRKPVYRTGDEDDLKRVL